MFFSVKRSLSATYPAPILTIFETKDENRCLQVYTGEKFPNFCAGGFPNPINVLGTVEGGVLVRGYRSNGTILSDGNYFGGSRHPKDVPFVREFWWRRYGLDAISPQKPNFGHCCRSLLQCS